MTQETGEESNGQTDVSPYDPFDGGTGTNLATLITLMRIYDVLLAIYAEENDDKASALMQQHELGKVLASLPQYGG